MTSSEENYIKGIFHLSQGGQHAITTSALAEKMETKPSSVTDMVKRLSEKGLLHYKKYQGVRLTEKGTGHALKVIRKHRLWEVFLVDKLDFAWDEVHEVAEQLEHIESEMLVDRLDALLNFPEFDPGVKDSSSQFLKFLDKHHIELGNTIEVLEKESFDRSMYIQVGKRKFQISHQIASNLYVKPQPE